MTSKTYWTFSTKFLGAAAGERNEHTRNCEQSEREEGGETHGNVDTDSTGHHRRVQRLKPLVIDLFCGLGGWAEGFLIEGYRVVGFDNVARPYPGQLVLQDVLTLDGRQFRNAACIVASPPCQEFSYMAMPWKRAKEKAAWYREFPFGRPRQEQLNRLFNACFRIQREASEATKVCDRCAATGCVSMMLDAVLRHREVRSCQKCLGTGRVAGRHVPMVVENVKGAQPWVGRAKWHYGSFYLWGDVPALMPLTSGRKNGGGSWFAQEHNRKGAGNNPDGRKLPEGNCSPRRWEDRQVARLRDAGSSSKRGQASAEIAKIPFPLAQHIAKVYKPAE